MTGRILAIGFAMIVLLGVGYAYWTLRTDRAMRDDRVELLKTELAHIRGSIAKFKREQGRNPHSLEELVPRYLRHIPNDPITHQPNWKLDTEEEVTPSNDFGTTTVAPTRSFVLDVHSAAAPYSTY